MKHKCLTFAKKHQFFGSLIFETHPYYDSGKLQWWYSFVLLCLMGYWFDLQNSSIFDKTDGPFSSCSRAFCRMVLYDFPFVHKTRRSSYFPTSHVHGRVFKRFCDLDGFCLILFQQCWWYSSTKRRCSVENWISLCFLYAYSVVFNVSYVQLTWWEEGYYLVPPP